MEEQKQARTNEQEQDSTTKQQQTSTNEQEQQASANEQEQQASANEQEQQASANEQEQQASANEQEQQASANEQEQQASANEQEQQASANEQEQAVNVMEDEENQSSALRTLAKQTKHVLNRVGKYVSEYYMPKQPVTIMLIGSTGNGKSTLGNFLLDPSPSHIYDKPSFLPAQSNMPETKEVKVVRGTNCPFHIVDTPGLNEGDSEDLRHMMDIVQRLKDLQSISACILCIKFDTKIDIQFRATIDYYRKLLPRLFEENVLVVLTNYCCDDRSLKMRKRRGIDDQKVIEGTISEIAKLFDPPNESQLEYLCIDALPYGPEEKERNLTIRKAIFEKATSMPPVSVTNLKVMKTPALKQMHDSKIVALDGKISGFKMELIEENPKAKDVLCNLETSLENMFTVKSSIQRMKDELNRLDTAELVIGRVWRTLKKWKLMYKTKEKFEIKSDWPIIDFKLWPAEKAVSWSTKRSGDNIIFGEVSGEFMRGLNATLTIMVHRRDKYDTLIQTIKKRLSEEKKSLKTLKTKVDGILQQAKEMKKEEVELLHEYINEKIKEKLVYCLDSMTMEEASAIDIKT